MNRQIRIQTRRPRPSRRSFSNARGSARALVLFVLAITGALAISATVLALLAAAPQSLAWQVPLAALAACILPWAVRQTRELGRRAVEARTYTG